ncbi:MAG TPA: reverse transcriptase domain-containing protein [Cellvibrionaceae bacterium]|nr:reverse transcriptase domain-containing protein [Cellvibrionaceae bacterium]
MKLIAEKYRTIKPTINYLNDPIIITQAWKKTHGYIRSFNWYADTLALDISALGIEENAHKWAEQIKKGSLLHPIELVPAAKSEPWIVDEVKGWVPKSRDDKKPPLRPLAHITIRDQTWASAVMLCLADAVETAQGDCSNTNFSFKSAQENKVYSYGNRLVCDWQDERAWFRWGNSDTYRKFFTDYQNFIERPIAIGKQISESSADQENVYVVSFDLSKFYNKIDRTVLIERLKALSREYGNDYDDMFWQAVARITNWQWRDDSLKYAKKIKEFSTELGLPQGLVASGFFANAYLVEFDRAIGENINRYISSNLSITLHDYCRYVDDLRLVIHSESTDIAALSDELNIWIGKIFKKTGNKALSINPKKTKITKLSDLDNAGSISSRIKMIQSELSGPADRDILESSSGLLEGLLNIESDTKIDLDALKENKKSDIKLVQLTQFDHDIRPDTLKRFAANRLESIMRSKRKIDAHSNENADADYFIKSDNESELLAKKLILAWMKDPSLGLVLRKAIEIFPNPDMFEPVIEAIYSRSTYGKHANKITCILMDYLLADLFRCAADFHGYFQTVSYPNSANPSGILELISRFAQKTTSSKSSKKFVARQALMLLGVLNKPILVERFEDSIQQTLHAILAGSLPKRFQQETIALFEVASQITDNTDSYASILIEHIEKTGTDKINAIIPFAKRGGPFWLSLWKILDKREELLDVKEQLLWAKPSSFVKRSASKQRLAHIICSEENGFEHEAALLKLAIGLVKLACNNPKAISASPNSIMIDKEKITSWIELWHKDIEVKCILVGKSLSDPRFSIPSWIETVDGKPEKERAIIYWVGSILRASVLGGVDFTGNRWKKGKTITYKGLRTSWYKRRMGMMHSPEKIIGEFATVTSWFSELLMVSLQWPGFQSSYVSNLDIGEIASLEDFLVCLKSRLKKLNDMYCRSSYLPLLPTRIDRPKNDKDNFRLVTVQQLLPKTNDFSLADPKLNNPITRAKHREHIMAICQLTYKTLEAKLATDTDKSKPAADLIVFPEVAIHIDDQDIIKRLADKTQSMIFAGLVFTDHNGKLVNIARWFIPHYKEGARQWIIRDQGKQYMTPNEKLLGVEGYRPCQHLIEVHGHPEGPFKLSGAICYDATDISLAADLRDKTDLFVVAAHNSDVATFDSMAAALHFHMFQHVVITNIGEYGGTTIQAPFKLPYHRLICHVHGSNQISINMADLDLAAFRRNTKTHKEIKSKPAGIKNR